MKNYVNQNPEQIARDKIDSMLIASGWNVQLKNKINLSAKRVVAVREYQTDIDPADYILFVDRNYMEKNSVTIDTPVLARLMNIFQTCFTTIQSIQ